MAAKLPSPNPELKFDGVEEVKKMETTFCNQVSDHEYTEMASSETDKALGELCLLLERNPEVYAKILRKKKQDELERSGPVSFMKSKVLGLVKGDEYAQSLVSDAECQRQINALKADICKTFQAAEESKLKMEQVTSWPQRSSSLQS